MAQPQRIRHHENRGKSHSAGRQHWRQKNTEGRVKRSCRDRDQNHIIGKSPEKILLDIAHRDPAQRHRHGDPAEVTRHQNDICRLNRDIRAAADRKTDIGFRQRRRIIDAITDECDGSMPHAELPERGELSFRQHFGDDYVDPDLFGNRLGRTTIIAGHHDDFEPLLAQDPDRAPRIRRNGVGDHEGSGANGKRTAYLA